jgi:hypothetical protein
MKKTLSLSTIGDLHDGFFGPAVNNDIAAAIKDCDERPRLDKPRTITIKLEIRPDPEGDGVTVDQVVVATSNLSLPPTTTRKERLSVTRGGKNAQPQLIVPEVQTRLPINQEDDV